MIYLDNATFTPPSEKAISAMQPYLFDKWGSPHSPHSIAEPLFTPIKQAYQHIYALLGGSEEYTFVLTSSGAEAINHVIEATFNDVTEATGKNHFVTSANESAAMLYAMTRLEKAGCRTKFISPNKEGIIKVDAVGDAITPRTALLSLSWVNGITGLMNPISHISTLCKERGIRLHVDVTHALGKMFFDWEDLGADIITFNGSQIHGPQGTGGIFFGPGVTLSPFIVGGSDQMGCRAGGLNVSHLVALGEAAKETQEARDYVCTEVARLRSLLEEGVDGDILFQNTERLPNTTVITFPGVPNEAMLYTLSAKGVCATTGGGELQQIGHLLSSTGVDEKLANEAVSFSLSRTTTEEEIQRAIVIINESAHYLRSLSYDS